MEISGIADFSFDNNHQRDALASALFAYNGIRDLLGRIDSFAAENNKPNIQERIKEIVISKRLSII